MIPVALDIGNVLVHANFENFIKNLSQTLNITIEEANYFMKKMQKHHDLGHTTIIDELIATFQVKSEIILQNLVKSWNDMITPSAEMIDFFNELRTEHDVKIALVSNIGLEHAKNIEDVFNIGNGHDLYKEAIKFYSCDVGARKPSMIYYNTFLQIYPSWKGCIYVDDLDENLQVSQQFGFKTFKFSLQDDFVNSTPKKFNEKLVFLKKSILSTDSAKKNSRWH